MARVVFTVDEVLEALQDFYQERFEIAGFEFDVDYDCGVKLSRDGTFSVDSND